MAIKIFIDMGHNPSSHNLGASADGLYEHDINYNVGFYLAELLRANSNFDVRVSRNSPTEVLGHDQQSSLRARVDAANNWGANYFLSIHANANVNPKINGTEMYVYSRTGESYALAQYLLNSIVQRVGTRDNLVRVNSTFYVLRHTKMPAVLLELAYLTNPGDHEILRTRQHEFAEAIYAALLDYFRI